MFHQDSVSKVPVIKRQSIGGSGFFTLINALLTVS